MELYFAPLACSLATRIALYEAGAPAKLTRVDLMTRRTEDGADYLTINPLGQVPALRTAGGALLTENAAVLQHIADAYPDAKLVPADREGRSRLQQWLSFISTELHKGIYALHFDRDSTDELKAFARKKIPSRFAHLEQHLTGREFLLDGFTIADAYLVTVLNWTRLAGPDLREWAVLHAYHQRMLARPAVVKATGEEFALYSAEQQRKSEAKPGA